MDKRHYYFGIHIPYDASRFEDWEDSMKYFINTIKNKNMKPFDFERAKIGDQVIYKRYNNDCYPVRLICFDRVSVGNKWPVIGLIHFDTETSVAFDREGNDTSGIPRLFMAPVKRQEWRALYKRNTEASGYKISNFSCENEQDVLNSRERKVYCNSFVKAILIREWEE